MSIEKNITFSQLKSSFENYRNEIQKVPIEELNFLWFDDYYDGMLYGMLEYNKTKFRFEIITDYSKEIFPRIFAIVALTEEEIEEETCWNNLFLKHVGNHNNFTSNEERYLKPQIEHKLFYDKFNDRKQTDFGKNQVKAWFIEE
jgi:hypothetical protein